MPRSLACSSSSSQGDSLGLANKPSLIYRHPVLALCASHRSRRQVAEQVCLGTISRTGVLCFLPSGAATTGRSGLVLVQSEQARGVIVLKQKTVQGARCIVYASGLVILGQVAGRVRARDVTDRETYRRFFQRDLLWHVPRSTQHDQETSRLSSIM